MSVFQGMIDEGEASMPRSDFTDRLERDDVTAQEVVDTLVAAVKLQERTTNRNMRANQAAREATSRGVSESTMTSIQSHYMTLWSDLNARSVRIDKAISDFLQRQLVSRTGVAEAVYQGVEEALGPNWKRRMVPGAFRR